MADHWRAAASCRGTDPKIFYPSIDVDDEDQELADLEDAAAGELGIEAKRICSGCPVARPCLRFAVRVNDRWGIWAGLNDQRRQVLRRLWAAEDLDGYSAAVDEALRWVTAVANGDELELPETPGRGCDRCGSWIEPGQHPTDRNGPGATCGLPSTYNKGCRCRDCIAGKIAYRAAGDRPRGKVSEPLDLPTRKITTMDETTTDAGTDNVVELNGADTPAKKTTKKTAKKTAKKATKKAPAAKPERVLEDPIPLAEFFADDGLDWELIEAEGAEISWELWNRLGDNATRAGTGGWWWSGDWWAWGAERYTEEQIYAVVDPMRITTKTLSNRAWVCRTIPREHRRVHAVAPSLHMLAAELDDLDLIDEALLTAETEDLNWAQMRTLVRKLKGIEEPAEEETEEEPEEDPTRSNGTLSISAAAGYKDDLKAIVVELEEMAERLLDEHGVGGATVTHTVR